MNEESFGIIPYRQEAYGVLYLLIKHHGGHWGFPKGHSNPGESDLDAARREFQEETGIRRFTILENLRFHEDYVFVKGRKEITKRVTYFVAEVHDSTVIVQETEVSDFCWVNFDAGVKLLTFDGSKLVLAKVRLQIEED